MLKIYCSDCGAPTNYTSNKPKFCTGCGLPFDKNISKIPVKNITSTVIQKPQIKQLDDDEYDDYDNETEINHVPNLNKLDCEIVETYKRGEKIGNIVGTSERVPREKNNLDKKSLKYSKAERKKFLEEFSKEAGALKPRTRTRKNAS